MRFGQKRKIKVRKEGRKKGRQGREQARKEGIQEWRKERGKRKVGKIEARNRMSIKKQSQCLTL